MACRSEDDGSSIGTVADHIDDTRSRIVCAHGQHVGPSLPLCPECVAAVAAMREAERTATAVDQQPDDLRG
jgi:hypothetical protein